MPFKFSFTPETVTLKLIGSNSGFLKKVFGGNRSLTISEFSREDQKIALALADLKCSADEVGSEITISEDEITFSHVVLAAINSNFSDSLSLPPIVHLTLETDVLGIPGSSDFKLTYKWLMDGQKQNPIRTGAVLKTSEGLRRIPSWILDAIEIAEDQVREPSIEQNWYELAKFRQALDPDFDPAISVNSNITMTNFLRNLRVKISDSFSILPDEDQGSGLFEVIPFSNRNIANELENGAVSASNSMSELPEHELLAFQKRFRSQGSLNAYLVDKQSYLVVDPTSKVALDVMAEMKDASLQERRDFIKNPRLRINEAVEQHLEDIGELEGLSDAQREEAIEQVSTPIFVETAEYSERVTGKTIYTGNSVDSGDNLATTWLPEVFSEPQRDFLKDLSIQKLLELNEKIRTAIDEGKSEVTFLGNPIPASEASVQAISALVSEKNQNEEFEDTGDSEKDDVQSGPVILESENNFEKINWRADILPRDVTISNDAPETIKTELRPHQIESLEWQIDAWEAGLPGILNADEQGLGKTLQTLSFLAWVRAEFFSRKTQTANGPILIVAPTSLLENWEQEVKTHMSSVGLGEAIRLYGSSTSEYKHHGARGIDTKSGEDLLDLDFLIEASKQGDGHKFWVLTTYTTLTNYQHSLGKIPFSVAVFDEIQALKNPGSLRALAAAAMRADFRLGLTGTPIENSTSDLWAILDQISPGRLVSLSEFRKRYAIPDTEKMEMLYDLVFKDNDGLPPMAIRRLKENVAKDLPEKTRILHAEAMSPKQSAAYEAARRKLIVGQKGAALKMLHHIRSVSVHPDISADLVSDEFINLSARLKSTFEILDDIYSKNERALVFIEHIQMQYRFIELLKARYNLDSVDLINGKTPIKQRQKIVNRFQSHLKNDRGFDVLVLGPKAAGTGLTLTAATHVIHLSRWWNPAVEEQCNDRVHRIGQTKPITVHVPLSVHPEYEEQSFDLLLHSLMTRKRKLASSALWPMGDTEADMQQLQQSLGSEASSKGDEQFVKNSILKMFERDEVVPTEIVNDKTYVYD